MKLKIRDEVVSALKYGLSYELYKALLMCYGKRGEKAFFYVKEGRVKKYKDFFVVVGREEYLVDDDFCTCKDFQINLKFKSPCAHILAVFIAKNLKRYDEFDAYYLDYIMDKMLE
jgi:predicted nucleic acid-binding Zn finger protein